VLRQSRLRADDAAVPQAALAHGRLGRTDPPEAQLRSGAAAPEALPGHQRAPGARLSAQAQRRPRGVRHRRPRRPVARRGLAGHQVLLVRRRVRPDDQVRPQVHPHQVLALGRFG